MQKALVVRAQPVEASGRAWSQEVDQAGGQDASVRDLLASGWQVAHTCPMPGEIDGCCLVVLERPQGGLKRDVPLAAINEPVYASAPASSSHVWDGETIPLSIFGVR
jgi:hypothetical protein